MDLIEHERFDEWSAGGIGRSGERGGVLAEDVGGEAGVGEMDLGVAGDLACEVRDHAGRVLAR